MNFNTFLMTQLNQEQKEAVEHTRGSLLIVAGAGSGKTRVITARITNLLLNHAVDASTIVALTFTNKAAHEMKERVQHFLSNTEQKLPFIGTFHAYCLTLLKQNQHLLSSPFFSILDEDDRMKLITALIKRNNLQKQLSAKTISYHISHIKNSLSDLRQRIIHDNRLLAEIYHAYEKEKTASKCLDFDDLLLQVLELCKQSSFKQKLQSTVQHILVDEYQDTNVVQHALLKEMTLHNGQIAAHSICVVGDEDQSIYSWRGATVTNMLHFRKDFPDTTIITIEQNYRSAQPILHIANQIIIHNTERNPKTLRSIKAARNRAYVLICLSEYQEGQAIAHYVKTFLKHKPKSSIAILYRTHFQSRAIEEAFIKYNIPYKIIGGINFYERKEIKDILAYLRLIVNPFDRTALMRIINTPTRGLGPAVEELIYHMWSDQPFLTFKELLTLLIEQKKISGKKAESIELFLHCFKDVSHTSPVYGTVEHIITHTGYIAYLKNNEEEQEVTQRIDNVNELLNAINFLAGQGITTIDTFLDHVALMQEHAKQQEESHNPVFMMTLHAAKGLEFDSVIIAGIEEGILPSKRAADNKQNIEEERRLLYVGITRAKEYLLLTRARYRYSYGTMVDQACSRFLKEIPSNAIQEYDASNYYELQLKQLFNQWIRTSSPETSDNIECSTNKNFSLPLHSTKLDKSVQSPVLSLSSTTHIIQWKQNQVVKHHTFGFGVVKSIDKKAQGTYLIVKFREGIKKISTEFVEKI